VKISPTATAWWSFVLCTILTFTFNWSGYWAFLGGFIGCAFCYLMLRFHYIVGYRHAKEHDEQVVNTSGPVHRL
jgi:hypothetical protein